MSTNKKRILFISPRFPYPMHKGDQLVVYNCLKYLSITYTIDLITFCDNNINTEEIYEVKKYCKELRLIRMSKVNIATEIIKSFFTKDPMQVAYFKSYVFQAELVSLLSSNNYDLLFPFTVRMSQYVENMSQKKYIHLIDSMYLNMQRREKNEKNFFKKFIFKYEANKVREYEQNLLQYYDKLFLVSQIDKDVIDKNSKIEIFPNGVIIYDYNKDENNDNSAINIVFSGNMGYFPNQDAVEWFILNCWELITNNINNIKFKVIGKNPSKKLESLVAKFENIELIGFVESMEKELFNADIAIAPMQSGSGIQNKILEAMAVKTPVITTRLGLGDIKAKINSDILLANTPEDYIRQIKYLQDKKKRKEIGENGYIFVKEHHSWTSIINNCIDI